MAKAKEKAKHLSLKMMIVIPECEPRMPLTR